MNAAPCHLLLDLSTSQSIHRTVKLKQAVLMVWYRALPWSLENMLSIEMPSTVVQGLRDSLDAKKREKIDLHV